MKDLLFNTAAVHERLTRKNTTLELAGDDKASLNIFVRINGNSELTKMLRVFAER